MDTLPENQYKIREMGYLKLKNITHPQQIFKVYLGNDDYEDESANNLKQNLIENGITVVDMDSYNVEDVYSTAILYVKNIGADDSESISFNLTENLIQDLGYINQLRTPGFNEILPISTLFSLIVRNNSPIIQLLALLPFAPAETVSSK